MTPGGTGSRAPLPAALGVLFGHLPAVSAASMTLSLPLSLAAESVVYQASGPGAFWRAVAAYTLVVPILLPWHAAVFIAAAREVSAGRSPRVGHLLRAAATAWPRVFKAWILPAFLIVVGLFGFLVPGVLLAFRYLLVEVIALHEKRPAAACRERSAELVDGRWGSAFFLLASVFVLSMVMAVVQGLLLGLLPGLDNFVVAAFGDVLYYLVTSLVYAGAWFLYLAAPNGS